MISGWPGWHGKILLNPPDELFYQYNEYWAPPYEKADISRFYYREASITTTREGNLLAYVSRLYYYTSPMPGWGYFGEFDPFVVYSASDVVVLLINPQGIVLDSKIIDIPWGYSFTAGTFSYQSATGTAYFSALEDPAGSLSGDPEWANAVMPFLSVVDVGATTLSIRFETHGHVYYNSQVKFPLVWPDTPAIGAVAVIDETQDLAMSFYYGNGWFSFGNYTTLFVGIDSSTGDHLWGGFEPSFFPMSGPNDFLRFGRMTLLGPGSVRLDGESTVYIGGPSFEYIVEWGSWYFEFDRSGVTLVDKITTVEPARPAPLRGFPGDLTSLVPPAGHDDMRSFDIGTGIYYSGSLLSYTTSTPYKVNNDSDFPDLSAWHIEDNPHLSVTNHFAHRQPWNYPTDYVIGTALLNDNDGNVSLGVGVIEHASQTVNFSAIHDIVVAGVNVPAAQPQFADMVVLNNKAYVITAIENEGPVYLFISGDLNAALRLNQRNDGLGISPHPRLNGPGTNNTASSVQLSQAPRMGGTNTYS